ncbi:MAG: MFS transporter [Candidatus Velamenicoccus archaeovorus]
MAVQDDATNPASPDDRGGGGPDEPLIPQVAPLFAAYTAFGVFWGVWVVVFADFLAARGISEGLVGLYLGALAAVSILTMTLVAPRLQRLPPAATVSAGLACMGLGALCIAFGAGRSWLALGFVLLGLGNAFIDVFVNVGAQAAEVRHRRPVLQLLHASYSVGGIVGALGAAILHVAGASFGRQLAAVAVVLFGSALWNAASPWLREPPPAADAVEPRPKVSLAVFLRSPVLILPAMVVLSAFMVEGSMDIWSVIYLRRSLAASVVTGGIAFAAFSGAMAVGRLLAGRLLFGLGYRATIQLSGAGSVLAGLVAAIAHSATVAGVAFLLLGFCVSWAAPAAFGMIGETEADPVLAVAGMTTVGYSGFVVGPPIMGWLAQTAGLRATMLVIVLAALGVALGGLGRRREARPTPPG